MRPLLPLLLSALLACGDKPTDDSVPPEGDTDADSDSDTDTDTWDVDDLAGSCGYEDHIGRIELAHWDSPGEGFATVSGEVLNGVIPVTVLFEKASQGGCVLWQKINPFCEDPCEPDEACNHAGECVPYPLPQDVGPIPVNGLTSALILEADAYGYYWDTTVSYPLFEPGARITAKADGLFELRGIGVGAIELPEEAWELVPGQDMPVTWTPGDGNGRVELTFNIDQHGITPLTMICDLPDTGSASVPATLLEQMVDNGVTGYPSSWIRRRTADSVSTELGCVDLLVYSHSIVDMTVHGYVPCSSDHDCPEGQHCNLEIQICEDD
jgi:hypothetical protein